MSTADDRFAANLAYFETAFPAAAEALRDRAPSLSQAIEADGQIVNIRIDGSFLYDQPAAAHGKAQVAAFLSTPQRYIQAGPEGGGNDSPVSIDFLNAMPGLLRQVGAPAIPTAPTARPGYLFVIGLGLGVFLDALVTAIEPRHVVIVEPFREFFRHSARAFDWAAMIEPHRRRGVTFDFGFQAEPAKALNWVSGALQRYGAPLVDGAYIFTHYGSWATGEIRRRFDEHIRREVLSRGYYEDEIKMVGNASANFLSHGFRLLDAVPRPRRPEPAFIVGAGPSLDDAIPTIKAWRDHAVIFSSGSALHILLHHGIVPDFHTELENHPSVIHAKLKDAADRHPEMVANGRLAPIRLIASATVAPEVPALFDERYLFFRGGVSSTLTFGRFYKAMPGVAPYVANTSVATAVMLGFGSLYLFGCDCGQRPGRRRHARHVIYETNDDFAKITQSKLTLTCPGNFGGTVNTDYLYEWSRVMMEMMIATFRADAVNCSDGARIEGARPLAPGSLKLSGPRLDKPALLATVRESCPSFEPGEFLRAHGMDAYDGHWRAFIAEVRAVFATARRDDPDIEAFYRRWKDYMVQADSLHGGVPGMVTGTGLALPRIAWFFITRIGRDDQRRAAYHGFLDLCERTFLRICLDGQARFAALRERLAANA